MIRLFFVAPFFRIVLFFLLGIVAQNFWSISPYVLWLFLLGALLLILSYLPICKTSYSFRFLFGLGLFFMLFALGVFVFAASMQKKIWDKSGEVSLYKMQIKDQPIRKPKTYQCKAFIINAKSENKSLINQNVILYVPTDGISSGLIAGDCLLAYVKLEESQEYLKKQSFVATGFVKKNDWMKIDDASSASIHFLFLSFRRSLLKQLKEIVPDPDYYSIASALMFGYKQDMEKELRQTFANVGVGHVLAVSGLHFSILFGMIYFLLSFIGNTFCGRIIQYCILLPLIWGFALMVNLTPSVVRAALMLSIVGIGRLFFIKALSFNTVVATAFFMLLLNPLLIYDIGFQLSFSAVIAILLINPHLSGLYKSDNKIIQYFWDLITVSVSAQIGVLPLSVYYFHQLPLLFLLANIGIIPMVTILLFLIPFSLFLKAIIPSVTFVFIPLNKVLEYMFSYIDFLNHFSSKNIDYSHLNLCDVSLSYIIIILISQIILKKRIVYLYAFLIIVVFRLIYYLC